MQKTHLSTVLSVFICFALIAAVALFTTGCENGRAVPGEETTSVKSAEEAEVTVLGAGSVQFVFSVTGTDGNEALFEIHTDKNIVGEALQELGVISGEEGPYGLYVKTVNGVTLDYDKDGMYWAFYEDGAYASNGADQTEINPQTVYSFKAEK